MSVISGKVVDVIGHGSIVQVNVLDLELDRIESIMMDHRPYQHMVEAEGNIMGRYVSYDGIELSMDDPMEPEQHWAQWADDR